MGIPQQTLSEVTRKPIEIEALLRTSGQVTLDANGTGVIDFNTDNAWQRWEVDTVAVHTNQAANATTVPYAYVGLNTPVYATASPGNIRSGISQGANADTFRGRIDVTPGDTLDIVFYPPPGSTPAQIATLAGSIAYATITGRKYTRRT